LKIELNLQTRDRVFRHSSAGGKFQRIYAFIGDSLIDLYLRQKLFQIYFDDLKYASIERGILASKRSLSYISKELSLHEELIYSGNINFSDYLLATIFEAYCCGIYFDYGFEKLFKFLESVLWSKREFLLSNFDDFVSKLKREYPSSKIKIEKIENEYKISLFIDSNLIFEIRHKNKEEGKYEIAKKFYLENTLSNK